MVPSRRRNRSWNHVSLHLNYGQLEFELTRCFRTHAGDCPSSGSLWTSTFLEASPVSTSFKPRSTASSSSTSLPSSPPVSHLPSLDSKPKQILESSPPNQARLDRPPRFLNLLTRLRATPGRSNRRSLSPPSTDSQELSSFASSNEQDRSRRRTRPGESESSSRVHSQTESSSPLDCPSTLLRKSHRLWLGLSVRERRRETTLRRTRSGRQSSRCSYDQVSERLIYLC